jgi:hypothetical protein
LRAFADIFAAVFHTKGGLLFYDLPVDGRGSAEGLSLAAESSLERDGRIYLEVLQSDGRSHALFIRQPKWVTRIDVVLGTQQLRTEPSEAYLKVERNWKKGERIALHYRMRSYVVQQPSSGDRLAIFHGPWLLAIDESLTPEFFSESLLLNRLAKLSVGENGDVDLGTSAAAEDSGTPFCVPIARFRVKYFPGGYPIQPSSAILRPLAENTAVKATTPWEFWFRIRKENETFADH